MATEYNPQIDYIVRLNNHLIRTKQVEQFRWNLTVSGPANNQTHHAEAIFNEEVIGSHAGNAKNVAKKYAAFHALARLEPSLLQL